MKWSERNPAPSEPSCVARHAAGAPRKKRKRRRLSLSLRKLQQREMKRVSCRLWDLLWSSSCHTQPSAGCAAPSGFPRSHVGYKVNEVPHFPWWWLRWLGCQSFPRWTRMKHESWFKPAAQRRSSHGDVMGVQLHRHSHSHFYFTKCKTSFCGVFIAFVNSFFFFVIVRIFFPGAAVKADGRP